MATTIQFKRGLLANLPTLAVGEPAFTTDTHDLYIGDGTTNHQIGGGGGTGTVTSVAMSGDGTVFDSTVTGSPITASGTLAPSLKSQTANTVLAAPDGSSGAPTFRALVAADLPAVSLTSGVSGILPVANGGSGTSTPSLVAGTGISVSGTWPNQTVAATGGGGGVTSVNSLTGSVTIAGSGSASVSTAGSTVTVSVPSAPPDGAAGGDLGANYPNPTVTRIQGKIVSGTSPGNGEVLVYNSSTNQYEPGIPTATPGNQTVSTKAGAYTALAGDVGKLIEYTGTGGHTLTLGTQAAGWWIDVYNGGTGVWTIGSLVVLTPGQATRAVSLGSGTYFSPQRSILVSNGGTGQSSFTNHGVLIGAGTSGINVTGAGTSGQVLTSNGASSDPTFQAIPFASLEYPGKIVGFTPVATGQTTGSTTYVDLTTADSVSFTLTATRNLLVEYSAVTNNTAASPFNLCGVFLDGSLVSGAEQSLNTGPAGTALPQVFAFQITNVAAGAHTVSVKHKVTAGTGLWVSRSTKVSILS